MSKWLLLSAFAFVSATAHAGIYLEPYVGYGMGTSTGEVDVQSVGIVTIDQDNKGVIFGGKLGYTMLGLGGGVDFMQFKSKDSDNTGQSDDGDSTVTNLGAFVQYTFPVLLKVSATYIFSSKSKDDDSTSTGKGFKVGLGYTGLPFIAINLDYVTQTYDDGESDTLTFNSVDIDSKLTMVSVSLPLDF